MNEDHLEFDFQAGKPDFPGVNNSSSNSRAMRNLRISYVLVDIEEEIAELKTLNYVDWL